MSMQWGMMFVRPMSYSDLEKTFARLQMNASARSRCSSVDLYAQVDEDEVCTAQLQYADRHHKGLTECGSSVQETFRSDLFLRRRHRSLFVGATTVKSFSSVNHVKFTWSSRYIFSSILARCSQLARFDSVSSCSRRFFKHFRRRSL